jgi:hypothetical protein
MRTHGDQSPVYGYEARLRGLAEPAQAGLVSVERHFNAGSDDFRTPSNPAPEVIGGGTRIPAPIL